MVVIQDLRDPSSLNPMEKLMDLLLDQPLLFILNGFGRARHYNHLEVIVIWIILQGVLSISQPPMFKVSLICLIVRVVAKA